MTSLAPTGNGPLLAAVSWLEHVLTGQLATLAAVIAVAMIGFRLLYGDLSVRGGARVVLGCFIVFGAPLIARGLIGAIQGGSALAAPSRTQQDEALPLAPLAPQAPAERNGNPFDPNPAGPR